MELKMKKIPFKYLPASWGLKGKTRDVAEAEYSLEGYDLERRLLDIKSDEMSTHELNQAIFDLDLKYNLITISQHKRCLTTLITDEKQKTIAILELDYLEKAITKNEYEKGLASVNNEPWVTVVNFDFGGNKCLEGSFELDWNDAFVEKLKADGYTGPTPDNIVNMWFMELSRNIALEEYDGVGNFNADADANLEALKRFQDTPIMGQGNKNEKN
jgi:hypothetical protein